MSRHLLIACMWLLLGACVTVAVAFACVAHAQLRSSLNIERLPRDELKQLGIAHHPPGSHVMVSIGSRLQSIGYEEMLFMSVARLGPPVAESLIITEIDAGWPMFAFRRRDRTESNDSFTFTTVVGAEVASTKSDALLLPFQPVLSGFTVNSLFYALLLWLLFATPFALRRMLRRRRGLCERCAYPVPSAPNAALRSTPPDE